MTTKEAQIALANLKRYISGGGAIDRDTNKAIDMAIKALELEPQWIPVTKKLPEKNVWVLVTFMMANGEVDTDIMRINRWDGGWDTHTFDMAYRETVIAWMPLPKPWREEDR